MPTPTEYDNSVDWSPTGSLLECATATNAFAAWRAIRDQRIAQDFLVSLLIKPRSYYRRSAPGNFRVFSRSSLRRLKKSRA